MKSKYLSFNPPVGYQLVRKLGEGAFKITYEAIHSLSGEKVALKKYKDPYLSNIDPKDLTINFLDLSRQHQNLMPTFWVAQGWLLEPLLDNSLAAFLEPPNLLPWKQFIVCAKGLLAGIVFMHENGLIHGDIKPHNMGLVSGKAVLTDFGTATILATSTNYRNYPGTIRTRPPELHKRRASLSKQSDVWMLAASFLAMRSGSYPFITEDEVRMAQTREDREHLKEIVSQRIVLGQEVLDKNVRDGVSPTWFADLLRNILRFDPRSRPDARSFYDCVTRGRASLERKPKRFAARTFFRGLNLQPTTRLFQEPKQLKVKYQLKIPWSCLYSNEGKLLWGGGPSCIYSFDPYSHEIHPTKIATLGKILSIASSGNDELVLGTSVGELFSYGTTSRKAAAIRKFDQPIRNIVFHKRREVFYFLSGNFVYLANLSGSLEILAELDIPAWSLFFSTRGDYLAVSVAKPGKGGIAWVNLSNNNAAITYEFLFDITAAAFAKHPSMDLFAIGSHWGGLWVVDAKRKPKTSREIEATRFRSDAITIPEDMPGEAYSPEEAATSCSRIVFGAKGNIIAAGHDSGLVVCWDLISGKEMARGDCGSHVRALQFLSDESLVAACDQSLVIF